MSVTRTSLTMLIATFSIAGCAKTPIARSVQERAGEPSRRGPRRQGAGRGPSRDGPR